MMRQILETCPLLDQHIADLARSGIDREQALAAGICSVSTPKTISAILNWDRPATSLGPCMVFAFHDADGASIEDYARLKPDKPRMSKDKPVKYESPLQKPNRPYFPLGIASALADPSAPLVITEGEKKALKATLAGFPCIGLVGTEGWSIKRETNPETGKKSNGERKLLPDLDAIAWQGRPVAICYDSDAVRNTDVKRAEASLAAVLSKRGAVVRIVRLPEHDGDGKSTGKVGLDDYLVAHPTANLQRLIDAAPLFDPEMAAKLKPTTASLLIEFGMRAELWHTPERIAYATVGEKRQTYPIRSTDFRHWLIGQYFAVEGKAPAAQAIADTLNVLDGQAVHGGGEHPVHLRVAQHGDTIYLALADADCRVIEIDAAGWRIAKNVPVRFRRTPGMLPLPMPLPGGRLSALELFVNAADDASWELIRAWLIQTLRPAGPFPVLALTGEQGSAKTTTARALRQIVDPNSSPVRTVPRDESGLAITATNSWIVPIDNVSYIPDWLSDGLCRLSTGGGYSARTLYSNDEETIFNFKRPAILTGIGDLATRGDLLERCLMPRLPIIPAHLRKTEREFWRDFDAAHAYILGALLTEVSGAIKALPDVRLTTLPRMADFAEWVTAAAIGNGRAPEVFQEAYDQNQAMGHETALESSPIVAPLYAFLDGVSFWEGTASALLEQINWHAGEAKNGRHWPRAAHTLMTRLTRLAPHLRTVGIEIETGRESGGNRQRKVKITRHSGGRLRDAPGRSGTLPGRSNCNEASLPGAAEKIGSVHD